MKGPTGEQGVIIPQSNVTNLMLRDEVVQSVKDGKFHIYPVSTIDEGIELLTGIKAGKRNESGQYPQDTINFAVQSSLKRLAEKGKAFSFSTNGGKE